jgi:hypothetical protein
MLRFRRWRMGVSAAVCAAAVLGPIALDRAQNAQPAPVSRETISIDAKRRDHTVPALLGVDVRLWPRASVDA